MTQNMSTSVNFETWDIELASKNANYEKLYQVMLNASKESAVANVEILWRLGKVTYLMGLNCLDDKAIVEKSQETINYVQKALSLNATNFQANLWLAMASARLALRESGAQQKIKAFSAFLKHLEECARQKPNDQWVLFLEGRLQVTLFCLPDEEKSLIEQLHSAQGLSMPMLNLVTAEAKLRQSIALNPNFLDGYVTLIYLLVQSKKYAEALELIDKALTVERITKSDEILAKDIQVLKDKISSSTK